MKSFKNTVFTSVMLIMTTAIFSVAAAAENSPPLSNYAAESLNSKDASIVETFYKDLDQDDIQDKFDHCPNTLMGAPVDKFGCELDTDQDGVFDRLDQCPDSPAGVRVNTFGCEGDTDGDGVLDSKDLCPFTPESAVANANGCVPVAAVLTNIIFDTGEHAIRADQTAILKKDAATLNDLKEGEVILITGHTDSQGPSGMNERLSWRRANSTKEFIVNELGLNTDNVYLSGKGEIEPLADNETIAGRQENRRIQLKVVTKSELATEASLTLPDGMNQK
jgi:OOP family OmpA-OmpF porin